MEPLKILVVNDFASVGSLLQKYLSHKVDVIYFQKDQVITLANDPLFFERDDISSCVNRIKNLSKEYDVFITLGWFAAAVCYLAGVKYIMYFVDSFIDPKYRLWKKFSFLKRIFFNELFKDVLSNADQVVTCIKKDFDLVKKYRSKVIIIFPFIDIETFNPNNKKIVLGKYPFIFFSPQRIDPNKGHEIVFDAINHTKSDFIVLQTNWGFGEYYENMIKKIPKKVKIIPKISRDEMTSYYVSSNALLGQVSYSGCSSIEREAIACGIPVFCYESYEYTNNDPFFKSKDPKIIAEYIDKLVENEGFRLEVTNNQNIWLKKTFEPKKLSSQWDSLLMEMNDKNHKYKTKMLYLFLVKTYFHS